MEQMKNEARLKFLSDIQQFKNLKYVGIIDPNIVDLSQFPLNTTDDAEIHAFEDINNKGLYMFRWRFKISEDISHPQTLISFNKFILNP
jgi:hypothetical protein